MTLGERILKKRKECGLSQESLGSKLEVSRQTVYKWESDQAVPELPKLIAMAEIFNVKVGWLVAEEESDRKEQAYVEAAERIAAILSEIDFPEVVSVEMFLCEDGVKIADYQYEPYAYDDNAITNSGDIAGASEFSEKWMYFKRPDNLKLDPDKSYEEHLVVMDEYGRKIEYISSENGKEIVNATGR